MEAFRRLISMHHQSRVGHLGGNLSALDAMLVLYREILRPEDVFVLSKGHSAGALYVALWAQGYLSDADLESFHRDDTLLAGHPPARGIAQVAFATGSLGHGLSLAAGCALGARLTGSRKQIYCMMSDGEWQEGSSWEAVVFAAHHRLSNLTILIDANGLQGLGTTADVASMADLTPRLQAFHIDMMDRVDGHNPSQIETALRAGRGDGPRVIMLDTRKGWGIPSMEGLVSSHYLPPDADDLDAARDQFRD